MNTFALRKNKPLPALPCDEVVMAKVYMNALRSQDTRIKGSSETRPERIISGKLSQGLASAQRTLKDYARRSKRAVRYATSVAVKSGEEDEECKCTICLRSQRKRSRQIKSNRDVFAESKKPAAPKKLAAPKKRAVSVKPSPQVAGPCPLPDKISRNGNHRAPKPNYAILHNLRLCAKCRIECEVCKLDIKRTWRFALSDEGVLSGRLDRMLTSEDGV